jgi:group II intron reverse transcriptase/maturase
MNVEARLSRLARLASADKDKRFDRLYRELTKTDLLMYAYEQIKDNKGSKTPGIDGLNKFDWNEEKAMKLAAKLQSGKYEPSPVRRVLIDKKNKPGQKRPLGIPTFGDRVVQCALKLLLEALYEPIFMECSHGFRPRRACQTALHQVIDCPTVRIDWVVEGDIKGCFDNICHQKLLMLLQKRIKDDRLLKLIAKFLNAGYFERERWNPTKAGTPQGGIISPLLANIYLHELDKYVEQEFGANKTDFQTVSEASARVNLEWKRLTNKIFRRREILRGRHYSPRPKAEIERELEKLLKLQRSTPCKAKPIKPRITYVRYADDFVIMLRNLSKSEAERIKEKLTNWVRDEQALLLSPEKTLITHISDGFTFLGYKIAAKGSFESQHKVKIKIMIPYASAQSKLRDIQEICRDLGTPEMEVIRRINNILRGWMTYYRGVTAPHKVMSSVLMHTWRIYADYVSRKNGCNIAKAAKRWIARCTPSASNPKGGQKSWFAERANAKGEMVRNYLLCVPVPKCTLHEISMKIRAGNSRSD